MVHTLQRKSRMVVCNLFIDYVWFLASPEAKSIDHTVTDSSR